MRLIHIAAITASLILIVIGSLALWYVPPLDSPAELVVFAGICLSIVGAYALFVYALDQSDRDAAARQRTMRHHRRRVANWPDQ